MTLMAIVLQVAVQGPSQRAPREAGCLCGVALITGLGRSWVIRSLSLVILEKAVGGLQEGLERECGAAQ